MNTPSRAAIQQTIVEALTAVAPDIDPADVRPGVDLRQELDIDSMDYLNFIIRLHERFAIDIPEADYPQLATLEGCVKYVAGHIGA